MMTLKQRLIVDYSSLRSVAKILSDGQNELTLLFFSLSILFEFFGNWEFQKALKRILICFIILAIFETLFKSSIDLSFNISDKLIDQCKNTEFCSHYLAIRKGAVDSTLWSETVHIIKDFSSFWLHSIVSLIFKVAFVFTIQIYSLVYAITSVLYPLICTIGILPSPGEKAFVSLFQTLLWLFISPIILSVVIVLLASVTDVGIGPKGEVGLEGLLHLMIISLFSLGSLFLSWLLCKGEGVAAFGSKMAQMGTTVLAMSGFAGGMNIGRGSSSAFGNLGSLAAGAGKHKFKDTISNKVTQTLASKGIEVGASEIAQSKNSLMNSPILPKDSPAYKSLSKTDKFLHKLDSIVNSRENTMAKHGMFRDLNQVNKTRSNVEKLPIQNYKAHAQEKLAPYSKVKSSLPTIGAVRTTVNGKSHSPFVSPVKKNAGTAFNVSQNQANQRSFK